MLPIGDTIVAGAFIAAGCLSLVDAGISIYNSIFNSLTTVPALSKKIDWESGDKNHIWGCSKNHGCHDWSPFGIGPNDPKGWDKLLPLLKIVADQGQKWNNPNQTKPIPNVEYYLNNILVPLSLSFLTTVVNIQFRMRTQYRKQGDE